MQAQGKGNMEWAEEAGILAIWLLAEMDMVVIIDIFLACFIVYAFFIYQQFSLPILFIISCVTNVNSD